MTGSYTTFRNPWRSSTLATARTMRAFGNMPILTAEIRTSARTDSICASTMAAETAATRCTAAEFWAVTAVTAVQPYTRRAAKVLRSAWMPAPALLSEPATASTFGTEAKPPAGMGAAAIEPLHAFRTSARASFGVLCAPMSIDLPYLLFFGDAHDDLAAKTAIGVYQWRPEACVGQLRLPGCVPSVDLPELSVEEGWERGARTLLVGVVNRGGTFSQDWIDTIVAALRVGMDVASGLHARLGAVPAVAEAAQRYGRRLHDVRHPSGSFPIGTGEPRSGRRLLTVGTDCSVGKMYTSLSLHRTLTARGVAAHFRATGQTGIFIEGAGVAVDAIVSDFMSGAIEQLCPAGEDDHWDVIEGQGSLFHPSYAGVSLGLLHGAQPDTLVLCHEPTRTHMRGLPGRPLPGLGRCIEANLTAARVVSPDVRFAGISINTKDLGPEEARTLLQRTEDEQGLPCVDPARDGVERLLGGIV